MYFDHIIDTSSPKTIPHQKTTPQTHTQNDSLKTEFKQIDTRNEELFHFDHEWTQGCCLPMNESTGTMAKSWFYQANTSYIHDDKQKVRGTMISFLWPLTKSFKLKINNRYQFEITFFRSGFQTYYIWRKMKMLVIIQHQQDGTEHKFITSIYISLTFWIDKKPKPKHD